MTNGWSLLYDELKMDDYEHSENYYDQDRNRPLSVGMNDTIITGTENDDTITFFLFPLLEVHPNAWIFVLSFVFIGNLTILNLIIAILIDLLKTKDEN